ncbi:Protein REVERSION-TO-ETHYLENE SENSITIVITY1 [Platanthera guangdongensis]|uniref:Protein REVERSION-TO-ETHYLENE SENSITIVITY1 n=1 Tax=Platanthera guangdongensis TaxID=2320717 RepID=A0ABR2N531_9ASPA
MELKSAGVEFEDGNLSRRKIHDLWPLDELNPKTARFPCCVVWTPLPIISWLTPYIGHVGICREDGAILDFAGSNFVNVDNFAYGAVAKFLQLDRKQCCFAGSLSSHMCRQSYHHAERGVAISWDDALNICAQKYQHKSYNLFTCNCHSFVADCLNRLAYGGHFRWNLLNLTVLILWKGRWVHRISIFKSFFPFAAVICIGVLMTGWAFLIGMASFSLLLICWFFLVSYCFKGDRCSTM